MERVKKLASTDTLLQQYIKDVLSKADKLVNSPVPTSVRPCQDELMCLGFARRYTGSLIYDNKAVAILDYLCGHPEFMGLAAFPGCG